MFGNRVDLMMCVACGALWCFAAHGREPRSPVGVRWTYDPRDWQRAYDVDDGVSLNRWHLRQVRAANRGGAHPCGGRVCRFRQRRPSRHPDGSGSGGEHRRTGSDIPSPPT